MQVIQVMHGFQVCPISVRVAWGKIFPEDVHDDGNSSSLAAASSGNPDEVVEDGGEVFPVQLAFKSQPPVPLANQFSRRRTTGITTSRPGSATGIAMLGSPTTHNTNSTNSLPSLSMGGKSGMMATDNEISSPTAANGNPNLPGMMPMPSYSSNNSSAGSVGSAGGGSIGSGNASESGTNGPGGSTTSGTNGEDANHASGGAHHHHGNHHNPSGSIHSTASRTQSDDNSFFPGATAMGYNKTQRVDTHAFATDLKTLQPLSKTYLTPLLEKPKNLRNQMMKRQSNVERVNTNALSPQMTLFLSGMNTSIQSDVVQEKQTFRRTIPVSWAPAGGTDTHRKRTIATELHASIANSRKQSQQEYYHETYASHHTQIRTVQDNAKTLEKVYTLFSIILLSNLLWYRY
jgi:hypothetical protein